MKHHLSEVYTVSQYLCIVIIISWLMMPMRRSWMLPFISALMILGIMECLQRYDQKKMTFWLLLWGIFYHMFPMVLVFRLPVRKRINRGRVLLFYYAVGALFLFSCLMSDRWPYLLPPSVMGSGYILIGLSSLMTEVST